MSYIKYNNVSELKRARAVAEALLETVIDENEADQLAGIAAIEQRDTERRMARHIKSLDTLGQMLAASADGYLYLTEDSFELISYYSARS